MHTTRIQTDEDMGELPNLMEEDVKGYLETLNFTGTYNLNRFAVINVVLTGFIRQLEVRLEAAEKKSYS